MTQNSFEKLGLQQQTAKDLTDLMSKCPYIKTLENTLKHAGVDYVLIIELFASTLVAFVQDYFQTKKRYENLFDKIKD